MDSDHILENLLSLLYKNSADLNSMIEVVKPSKKPKNWFFNAEVPLQLEASVGWVRDNEDAKPLIEWLKLHCIPVDSVNYDYISWTLSQEQKTELLLVLG